MSFYSLLSFYISNNKITLFISVLKVLIKLYSLRVIDFFINIIIYLTNHKLKQTETELSDQIYELELQMSPL